MGTVIITVKDAKNENALSDYTVQLIDSMGLKGRQPADNVFAALLGQTSELTEVFRAAVTDSQGDATISFSDQDTIDFYESSVRKFVIRVLDENGQEVGTSRLDMQTDGVLVDGVWTRPATFTTTETFTVRATRQNARFQVVDQASHQPLDGIVVETFQIGDDIAVDRPSAVALTGSDGIAKIAVTYGGGPSAPTYFFVLKHADGSAADSRTFGRGEWSLSEDGPTEAVNFGVFEMTVGATSAFSAEVTVTDDRVVPTVLAGASVEAVQTGEPLRHADLSGIKHYSGGSATTHSVGLPAANIGDLLVLSFSQNGSDVVSTPPSGWTQIATGEETGGVTLYVWAKRADGTEGSSVDVVLSSAERVAAQVHWFRAGTWYDSGDVTDAIESATVNIDPGNIFPDPPSVTASWGDSLNMFLVLVAHDGDATVSTSPSNYVEHTRTTSEAGSNPATILSAIRRGLLATDDPGTYWLNATEESVSTTLAIRPASSGIADALIGSAKVESDGVARVTLDTAKMTGKFQYRIQTKPSGYQVYRPGAEKLTNLQLEAVKIGGDIPDVVALKGSEEKTFTAKLRDDGAGNPPLVGYEVVVSEAKYEPLETLILTHQPIHYYKLDEELLATAVQDSGSAAKDMTVATTGVTRRVKTAREVNVPVLTKFDHTSGVEIAGNSSDLGVDEADDFTMVFVVADATKAAKLFTLEGASATQLAVEIATDGTVKVSYPDNAAGTEVVQTSGYNLLTTETNPHMIAVSWQNNSGAPIVTVTDLYRDTSETDTSKTATNGPSGQATSEDWSDDATTYKIGAGEVSSGVAIDVGHIAIVPGVLSTTQLEDLAERGGIYNRETPTYEPTGTFVTDLYGRFAVPTKNQLMEPDIKLEIYKDGMLEDTQVVTNLDYASDDVVNVEMTPPSGPTAPTYDNTIFTDADKTPYQYAAGVVDGTTMSIVDAHIDYRKKKIEARAIDMAVFGMLGSQASGQSYDEDLSGTALADGACACRDCNSAMGPAAYLAELLDYADDRVAAPTVLSTGNLSFNATNSTIQRTSGTWSADGVVAGVKVAIVGSPSGLNDGTFTVKSETTDTITLKRGDVLTDQTNVAVTSVTADVPVTIAKLAAILHQPFDDLEVGCKAHNDRVSQAMIAIEVLRRHYNGNQTQRESLADDAGVAMARRDAYFAALAALGTSYNELRRLPVSGSQVPGAAETRSQLAARIGIATTHLDKLKLDLEEALGASTDVTISDAVSEEKLEWLFGIPATEVDLDMSAALPDPVRTISTAKIVEWQRAYLAGIWETQDREERGTFQHPIVEPDIVGMGEVRPVTLGGTDPNPAKTRLLARRAHVDTRLAALESAKTSVGDESDFDAVIAATQNIGIPSTNPWTSTLADIATAKDNGDEYGALLLPHYLTPAEFSYLYRVRDGLAQSTAVIPTPTEWDVVYGILVQAEKRALYATWRDEEETDGIVLSPEFFQTIPVQEWHYSDGDLTEPFLARFDVLARERFESTIRSRTAQYEAVADDAQRLVESIEEMYRPELRDAIIEVIDTGDDPIEVKAEALADELLIEMQMSGCARTTRIGQATATIQELIFSGGTAQLENSSMVFDDFDYREVWKWLGDFDSWRSAVAVALYPENYLEPGLVRTKSPMMSALLGELGHLRSESDAIQAAEKFDDEFRRLVALVPKASCTARIRVPAGRGLNSGPIEADVRLVFATTRGPDGMRLAYTGFLPARSDGGTEQLPWAFAPDVDGLRGIVGAVGVKQGEERLVHVFVRTHEGLGYLTLDREMNWKLNGRNHVRNVDLPDGFPPAGGTVLVEQNGGHVDQVLLLAATGTSVRVTMLQGEVIDGWRELGPALSNSSPDPVFSGGVGAAATRYHSLVRRQEGRYALLFSATIGQPANHGLFFAEFYGPSGNTNRPHISQVGTEDPTAPGRSDFRGLTIDAVSGSNVSAVSVLSADFRRGYSDQNGTYKVSDSGSSPDLAITASPVIRHSGSIVEQVVCTIPDGAHIVPAQIPFGIDGGGSVDLGAPQLIGPSLVGGSGMGGITEPLERDEQESRRKNLPSVFETHVARGSNATLIHLREAFFFAPLAIAQRLHRAAEFDAALRWFRTVYDFENPKGSRLYPGLGLTVGSAYQRDHDWLLDPLNPHAIASTRQGTYARFTLYSIAECLTEYAETEFAKDSEDSLVRARRLYETALDVLEEPEASSDVSACDVRGFGRDFVEAAAGLHPMDSSVIASASAVLAILGSPDDRDTLMSDILTDLAGAGDVHQDVADVMVTIDDLSVTGPSSMGSAITWEVGTARDAAGDTTPIRDRMLTYHDATERQFVAGLGQILGIPADDVVEDAPDSLDASYTAGGSPLDDPTTAVIKHEGGVLAAGSDAEKTNDDSLSFSELAAYVDPDALDLMYGFVPQPRPSFCAPRNPMLSYTADRAAFGLAKLRNCMTIDGQERVAREIAAQAASPVVVYDGQTYGGAVFEARSPSEYRFAALIERALILAELAIGYENAYLRARESFDNEAYRLLEAAEQVALARSNVKLEELRVDSQELSVDIASQQLARAQRRVGQLAELLAEPLNLWERETLTWMRQQREVLLKKAVRRKIVSGVLATAAAVAGTVATLGAGGVVATAAAATTAAGSVAGTGILDVGARNPEVIASQISASQQRAQFKRRIQQWEFDSELARFDVGIGQLQRRQADIGLQIARVGLSIAEQRADFAAVKREFLRNKYTSAEMYDWMIAVIEELLRWGLRAATSVAKLALRQLAFERQEAVPPLIGNDYFEPPQTIEHAGAREGILGASRLRADIEKVRQLEFDTRERKQHLTKHVSLARVAPEALQALKRTGVADVRTTLEMFDRDFPAHYLRLIEGVEVTIVALSPMTSGIKATVASNGLSRAVMPVRGSALGTNRNAPITQFETREIRRQAQVVDFVTSRRAGGAAVLRPEEASLLTPFEGLGVDCDWTIAIPKATNTLDYDTIADVVLSIDYSALRSPKKEEITARELALSPRREETWLSLRDYFVDAWHELADADLSVDMSTVLAIEDGDFVHGDRSVIVENIAFYFVGDGEAEDLSTFNVDLSFTPDSGPIRQNMVAGVVDSVVSSRQGTNFSELVLSSGAVNPSGKWTLTFPGSNTSSHPIRTAFADESLDDIFFAISYRVDDQLTQFGERLAIGAAYEWATPHPIKGLQPDFWLDASDIDSLWTDTAKTTQVASNGDAVKAWDDVSGHDRHFSYATSALTYRPTGFNGLPCVRSDGNGSDILLTSASWAHGTPCTVIAVYRNDDAANTAYLSQQGAGGTIKVFLSSDAGTGTGPGFYDGAHKAFGTVEVNDEDVFIAAFDKDDNARLYQRYEQLGSDTPYTDFSQTEEHRIFGGNTDLDLAELIFVPREITSAERKAVVDYLVKKWQLQ